MKSFLTSYSGLFSRQRDDAGQIHSIEIPIIQRDYAQGRQGEATGRIRRTFLGVLHRALTTGPPVGLDFVYGDVGDGVLRPLDGQQRLTTLFLLHWFLAWRAGRLDEQQSWKRFTYAVRASARLFCQRLVTCEPPADTPELSAWIADQPWYLYTWTHDPTIVAMLVMLEAIHRQFAPCDHLAAWQRLVDPENPAISFHLLPMKDIGIDNDLYIKMNSRGKPLTVFENFKAHFEQLLETSCPARASEFAHRIDGPWSDLLWPYRGDDQIVDDEFMRYFHFVTEVNAWRRGEVAAADVEVLAGQVYGPDNALAADNLDFLFEALDTWRDVCVRDEFEALFAPGSAEVSVPVSDRTLLFGLGKEPSVDLFEACCRSYGEVRQRSRVFSLPDTLLLYAVVLHRTRKTDDIVGRLRILRNLLEASTNELRLDKVQALVADVEALIVSGDLDALTAANQPQVEDERLKAQLLAAHPGLQPALHRLEDQWALRGCLAAFDLDAERFEARAAAFARLFDGRSHLRGLTGALLTAGDYARQVNTHFRQFGSSHWFRSWRVLLTAVGRTRLGGTRGTLGVLLDRVAARPGELDEVLQALQSEWLVEQEAQGALSWRYYFVKYPEFRDGSSGRYYVEPDCHGYVICMLHKQQMNSYYQEPYLGAMRALAKAEAPNVDRWVKAATFTGHGARPRWLEIERTGAAIRCRADGFELRPPEGRGRKAFSRLVEAQGIAEDLRVRVPQVELDGAKVDTEDRVIRGAAILRAMVDAGL